MTMEEKKDKQSSVMVWITMILHMLNHLISGAMPILYPEIMDEFTLSYSQLGLLRSANTLVTGVPQMFVGFLLLRRGGSGLCEQMAPTYQASLKFVAWILRKLLPITYMKPQRLLELRLPEIL